MLGTPELTLFPPRLSNTSRFLPAAELSKVESPENQGTAHRCDTKYSWVVAGPGLSKTCRNHAGRNCAACPDHPARNRRARNADKAWWLSTKDPLLRRWGTSRIDREGIGPAST